MTKDERFYYTDTKRYVRVSEVISVLNNPELNDWRAKAGYDNAQDWSETTSTIGTEIHRLISEIHGGEEDIGWYLLSPEIQNGLLAYKRAKLNLKFKPVQSEITLLSDTWGVGGTSDCLVKLVKNPYMLKGYWLFDWKTGSIFNPRTGRIYTEIPLQISTYFHLHRELYPQIDLVGVCAVRLNRETGLWTPKDLYPILAQDTIPHFEAFKNLKKIWDYLEEINGQRRNKNSV